MIRLGAFATECRILVVLGLAWIMLPEKPTSPSKPHAAAASAQSGSVNHDVIAGLLPKRDQCRKGLSKAETSGLIRNRRTVSGAVFVEYDETVWAALTHDDKMRQGLVVFCATMPDSGKHMVLVKGLHNGKTLGSVIDGNWFD